MWDIIFNLLFLGCMFSAQMNSHGPGKSPLQIYRLIFPVDWPSAHVIGFTQGFQDVCWQSQVSLELQWFQFLQSPLFGTKDFIGM